MGADDRNLTPEQRAMPRSVRWRAYKRLPMTCDTVRSILTEAGKQVMKHFNIDPADEAAVDVIMSQAFQAIRDRVTQPFRTEQMRLISELQTSKPEPVNDRESRQS